MSINELFMIGRKERKLYISYKAFKNICSSNITLTNYILKSLSYKFLGNALNLLAFLSKLKNISPSIMLKNDNKTDAEILKTIAFLM